MALLRGRKGHARVVILTIIEQELEAVQAAFGAHNEIGVDGVYTMPEFASNPDRKYPFIVARSSDRTNTPASHRARDLLEFYQPESLIVVGIGGGINRGGADPLDLEPQVGDVVVGRYVHYAPYTKNKPNRRSLRYISIDQPATHLIAHTEANARDPNCLAALTAPRPDNSNDRPNIHVSEVIAIESIAGEPTGEEQIAMLERFDNAAVVDMESMGVGRALHEYRRAPHYSPAWLVIRGVSDLVTADNPPLPGTNSAGQKVAGALYDDNNEQRRLWKRYASAAAAAFAHSLVARLLSSNRSESPADPGADRWEPGPQDAVVVGGVVETEERDPNPRLM